MAPVTMPIEIILMSYLDRLRGTGIRLFTGDARLLMGWCLATILGHGWDWITVPFIALFALGESVGWGTPIGCALEDRPMPQDDLEWWQVGILETNAWLALAVRGAMWGAPLAVLGYWDASLYLLPLVFAVAMPLAVWLTKQARRVQSKYLESDDWARQEYLRGLLIGAGAYIT